MCRFPVVSLTGKGENIYGRQSSEGSSAKQNEICVQPRRNSFASGLRHDRCPALRIGATNRDRDRSGGSSFHRGSGMFRFLSRTAEPVGSGEKGKDNGLVILLVTDQRCIQLIPDTGLRGFSPRHLQKNPDTIHDSLSERQEMGRRNGGGRSYLRSSRRFDGKRYGKRIGGRRNGHHSHRIRIHGHSYRRFVIRRMEGKPLPQLRKTPVAEKRFANRFAQQRNKGGGHHIYVRQLRAYDRPTSANL